MKLLGAAVVLASSALFGAILVKTRKKELSLLKQWCLILERIGGDLRLTARPIPEILKRISISDGQEAEQFIHEICMRYEQEDKSFSEIWTEGVKNGFPEMNERDREILLELGARLGRADLSQQLKTVDQCREQLRKHYEQLSRQYQSEQKLVFGVPTALGALVAILLF